MSEKNKKTKPNSYMLIVYAVCLAEYTEGTNSSKNLCLMFVYVLCKFVSGLICVFLLLLLLLFKKNGEFVV